MKIVSWTVVVTLPATAEVEAAAAEAPEIRERMTADIEKKVSS